jgi:hypothetical protein
MLTRSMEPVIPVGALADGGIQSGETGRRRGRFEGTIATALIAGRSARVSPGASARHGSQAKETGDDGSSTPG